MRAATELERMKIRQLMTLIVGIHITDIIPTATLPTAIIRMATILTAMDTVVLGRRLWRL